MSYLSGKNNTFAFAMSEFVPLNKKPILHPSFL
jgi:hypothetical protein